ncbi:unnamed protein product [Sphenostylis stenocarpa]|uniref:Uncharacterized protein n=1 Tax=Sphenostylis stenocarpa TaxID=92480 RepID=A0AA86VNI7_9FABA|nr:unnamed protein product [Sphenostylis stenocarpa]
MEEHIILYFSSKNYDPFSDDKDDILVDSADGEYDEEPQQNLPSNSQRIRAAPNAYELRPADFG